MEINRREIARYLGYKNVSPSSEIEGLIENCISLLKATADPRTIYEEFPLSLSEGMIGIGPLRIQSRDLSRNLAGCECCVLFAATLGIGVDTLIRRESLMDAAKGAVLQAAAAAMIEAVCNDFQDSLREKKAAEGLWPRPRFSPGYGDVPLTLQQEIIPLLKAPQRIGLTVTDSSIMVPMKSVSAFIGLGRTKVSCHHEGCSECAKKDCAFRLE